MKDFIHDDFLLTTPAARRLYHEHAAPEPILDYHNHLPPGDLAENRQFADLTAIWLAGDHYKWRAMRANGVDERLITGDADPFDKFKAWAATVPMTLRNPLYHWTHLELRRYFDVHEPLNSESAERIWHYTNERLATPELTTQGIVRKFRVTALCTTDDPADDLAPHRQLASEGKLETKVYPAFRPAKGLAIGNADAWNAWVDKLAVAAGTKIDTLGDLLVALDARIEFFHTQGCRLSDHGLNHCFATPCKKRSAKDIFKEARGGKTPSAKDGRRFASFVMDHLGRRYAERGWTMQLHLGALRNNNSRLLGRLGPDTGFDSIGDFAQAEMLSRFLDGLDRDDKLPRTILYNVNPADNYVLATMAGNFQDGTIPGKVQFGSGWWFLDQKEGMEWQLNALSNIGLLSRFAGMVTDSRSFMSFPRHEYFRRVLCGLIGRDVAAGELPEDDGLLGPLVQRICHANAREYLRLPD